MGILAAVYLIGDVIYGVIAASVSVGVVALAVLLTGYLALSRADKMQQCAERNERHRRRCPSPRSHLARARAWTAARVRCPACDL